jgi:hypothetical protein
MSKHENRENACRGILPSKWHLHSVVVITEVKIKVIIALRLEDKLDDNSIIFDSKFLSTSSSNFNRNKVDLCKIFTFPFKIMIMLLLNCGEYCGAKT